MKRKTIKNEFNIKRVVNFNLSTTDISTDNTITNWNKYTVVDNDVGTMQKLGSEMTFKNINLEQILGDLYNEYDYFNIELVQVMTLYVENGGGIFGSFDLAETRQLDLYMKGFDWYNSSFSQKSGCNRNAVHLTNLWTQYWLETNEERTDKALFAKTEYLGIKHFAYQNNTLCFKKSNRNFDIDMWFGHELGETIQTPLNWGGNRFPPVLFKFNIYPVEKLQ